MSKNNPKQSTFFGEFAADVFVKPAALIEETKITRGEAAKSFQPRAGTDRGRVLEFITSAGSRGATDQEIQIGLALDPSTQRPRRIELLNARLIQPSGTRKTTSGRAAVVWVITGSKS